jgi:hypothetical protein
MNDGEKAEIACCLQRIATVDELIIRLEQISAEFIGRPYVINPLGGGTGLPEQLNVNLDGFDCVTYMESVLALALARTVDDFADILRRIRYHNGEVSWASRNHYTSDWWQRNEATGFLRNLTRGNVSVEKRRRLNVVNGLPAKDIRFRVFPKRKLAQIRHLITTGDFICFASTKRNLDVFHTGVLIRRDETILLRHATRSQGAVVEQPLGDFLQANRMTGIILLRPLVPDFL